MDSDLISLDHERYTPSTLYRYGCRCLPCTEDHVAESRERHRTLAAGVLTEEQCRAVLERVAAGSTVPEAAEAVGVGWNWIYARAVWDADFAKKLDRTGWVLCVLGPDHPKCGTATGYRGSVQDDTQPGCRGTGCREWKRESSRAYRAAR